MPAKKKASTRGPKLFKVEVEVVKTVMVVVEAMSKRDAIGTVDDSTDEVDALMDTSPADYRIRGQPRRILSGKADIQSWDVANREAEDGGA